jgi:hypothetical protein
MRELGSSKEPQLWGGVGLTDNFNAQPAIMMMMMMFASELKQSFMNKDKSGTTYIYLVA